MRAVVTGAAGFIGSHLCDRLLADGHEVLGIDSITAPSPQRSNLARAWSRGAFTFVRLDLAVDDLEPALAGRDIVFHLAARSGLDSTSQTEFGMYVRDNLLATQRLLEALAGSDVRRLIYAGSHAVYGEAERLPTKESAVPRPLSSEGVTKLAAESLVHLYGRNLGLPVTVLRYFSVYGPRQRPDMAISRFVQALSGSREVVIHGDGEQTRDFTFVDDVVQATIRAAETAVVGQVLNIGGGSRSSLNGVLTMLEGITGRQVRRRYLPATPVDQRHSAASINLARRLLAWEPRVALRDGLERQWGWFKALAARDVRAGVQIVAV